MNHTYIITDKHTNKAICEIFNKNLADKINLDKYNVQTAYDYLCAFNSKVRA